jgi:RNA polymerase sigma-70 factor (ECF subfamily)
MTTELRTASLKALVAMHQAGDASALNTLIGRTADRLTHLASKMLRDFPAVREKEETGDVLNSAVIRLTRALGQMTPDSVRGFYRLAAEQIRRELRDLSRRYRRRPVRRLADVDPAAWQECTAELDRWAALQEGVKTLPESLREVFGFIFYTGLKPVQVAELLGVSDRQVRRLWARACLQLHTAVGDLPDA